MSHKKFQTLLIDSFDGTISEDDRKILREHILGCSACRHDEMILSAASGGLLEEEAAAPPTHYFTNLLPRVRNRLNESKGVPFAMPLWVQSLLKPVSAAVVVVVIFGLFTLLQPNAGTGDQSLQQILGQLPQEDIDNIPDGYFDVSQMGRASLIQHQHVLDRVSNITLISQKIEHDMVQSEIVRNNLSAEILPIENSVENLSDDEVSLVLTKLDDTISL